MLKKLPPNQKIYEAFSAIADDRVRMNGQQAEVMSSDRTKKYTVTWKDRLYLSDDNATFWQGYPGYPVLAVLCLQGKLPYDASAVQKMKDIPWKQLNEKHKRRYEEALQEVMDTLQLKGIQTEDIISAADKANEALKHLDIEVGRGKRNVR